MTRSFSRVLPTLIVLNYFSFYSILIPTFQSFQGGGDDNDASSHGFLESSMTRMMIPSNMTNTSICNSSSTCSKKNKHSHSHSHHPHPKEDENEDKEYKNSTKKKKKLASLTKEQENLQLLWSASGRRYYNYSEDESSNSTHKQQVQQQQPPPIQSIRIVISHCLHDLYWLSNFTQGYDMIDIGNNTINNTSPSITTSPPPITEITIISKCGKPVIGAPPMSNVIRLPNLGRCDHTYAYYLSHYTEEQEEQMIYNNNNTNNKKKKKEEEEIIVFLKDDRDISSIHQPGQYRTLNDMISISSQPTSGFACGMKLTNSSYAKSLSAYHQTIDLYKFKMFTYESQKHKRYDTLVDDNHSYGNSSSSSSSSSNNSSHSTSIATAVTTTTKKKYDSSLSGLDSTSSDDDDDDDAKAVMSSSSAAATAVAPFESVYKNLGEWIESILPSDSTTTILPFPLTEVCYGGVFVTTRTNILKTTTRIRRIQQEQQQQQQESSLSPSSSSSSSVWNQLQISLERGNNIEEGHFMERVWAGLLSTPITKFEMMDLLQYSNTVMQIRESLMGALALVIPTTEREKTPLQKKREKEEKRRKEKHKKKKEERKKKKREEEEKRSKIEKELESYLTSTTL